MTRNKILRRRGCAPFLFCALFCAVVASVGACAASDSSASLSNGVDGADPAPTETPAADTTVTAASPTAQPTARPTPQPTEQPTPTPVPTATAAVETGSGEGGAECVDASSETSRAETVTPVDFDFDGTDELVLTMPMEGRYTEVVVLAQLDGCGLVNAATASAQGSAGSPGGWGCRWNAEGGLDFIDWTGSPVAFDLDGDAREDFFKMFSDRQIWRFANSQATQIESQKVLADNPVPLGMVLCDAPGDRPSEAPDQIADSPQSINVPPPDRPCASVPGDRDIGPPVYRDIDGRGALDAIAPHRIDMETGSLEHRVWIDAGDCEWQDVGLSLYQHGGDRSDDPAEAIYARGWTCEARSKGSEILQMLDISDVALVGTSRVISESQSVVDRYVVIDGAPVVVASRESYDRAADTSCR